MPDAFPLVPEITEEDIDWVIDLMRLNALDGPRRTFLTARNTLDVSACPGSGKTTLVVAKLAILARKWTHRTKGICVLSHTNVAREEIQHRLGSTVVGQRLLNYPHFIDTIHGFVNRFLALPWLNSN
jgi:DNA helicase II / ATP-dependent DNA helicase PcrA